MHPSVSHEPVRAPAAPLERSSSERSEVSSPASEGSERAAELIRPDLTGDVVAVDRRTARALGRAAGRVEASSRELYALQSRHRYTLEEIGSAFRPRHDPPPELGHAPTNEGRIVARYAEHRPSAVVRRFMPVDRSVEHAAQAGLLMAKFRAAAQAVDATRGRVDAANARYESGLRRIVEAFDADLEHVAGPGPRSASKASSPRSISPRETSERALEGHAAPETRSPDASGRRG